MDLLEWKSQTEEDLYEYTAQLYPYLEEGDEIQLIEATRDEWLLDANYNGHPVARFHGQAEDDLNAEIHNGIQAI